MILTITTADVGTTPYSGILTVKSIRWIGVSGTAAGDVVRLEDPILTGTLLWRSVAAGQYNLEESITIRYWPNGVKVISLSSGVLDIEYDNARATNY